MPFTDNRCSRRLSRLAGLVLGATVLALPPTSHLAAQGGQGSLPDEPTIDDIIAAGERSTRIVGGVAAEPGRWQSLVAIFMRAPGRRPTNFCGGTVIGKEWVLTAAHCAAAMTKQDSSVSFFIREGTINLAGGDGRDVAVNRGQIISHPDYDPGRTLNDVALLKLNGGASAPRQKLVGRSESPQMLKPQKMSTVAGFGTTQQQGPSSSRLLQVDVPIVDQGECRGVYGADKITDATFCAGYKAGGKDSCQGDSGGPLFMPNGQGEQLQTGVVSWGKGCAQAGFYGVYASVGHFEGWIRSRVRDAVFVDRPSPAQAANPVQAGVSALTAGAAQTNTPGQLAQVTLDIAEGDRLRLNSFIEVRVTSSVRGSVVIYNENPGGRSYQLYPSKAFPAPGASPALARIEPGRTLSIPSAAQRNAGYRFQIRPPTGTNKLRVVVVPESRKVDEIINRHFDGGDILDLGAVVNEIVDAEIQTRGPEPVKIDPVDRGTAERIYEIID